MIRVGVLDDVKAERFVSDGVSWRRINGEEIASLDSIFLRDTLALYIERLLLDHLLFNSIS